MAPGIDEQTADRLTAMGAKPISVTLGRTSLNPMKALKTVRELRQVLRTIRPDVVIAYTIKPVVLGALAAAKEGVPTFVPLVTGLGYAFTGGREPKRLISRILGKHLYKRAFSRASIAIFQNSDDRAEFQCLGLLPHNLKTALIAGSGIDLDRFRHMAVPRQTSFLMIARLLKDKGVREYAAAAIKLKQQYPDVRVSLLGFLDSSPNTITQAELDQMVGGGIEFWGPREDVRPALAEHSVYVLPSYREGTPRSVLEAMAIGRAVITTDAPGCRETVVDGVNGFLVPPRDAYALFAAMKRFVETPDSAVWMGAESRRIAEDKFDVNKVNAALLEHVGL
jgi:glycosyltransferase involved in cell wall biosynthesis